eukprot:scaffold137664_cov27-Tisochrysis_lutea.AAC.3
MHNLMAGGKVGRLVCATRAKAQTPRLTSRTESSPSANSCCILCKSYTQKPVSFNSVRPPTPGPHTNTGEATIANATSGGQSVESKEPPLRPAVR